MQRQLVSDLGKCRMQNSTIGKMQREIRSDQRKNAVSKESDIGNGKYIQFIRLWHTTAE